MFILLLWIFILLLWKGATPSVPVMRAPVRALPLQCHARIVPPCNAAALRDHTRLPTCQASVLSALAHSMFFVIPLFKFASTRPQLLATFLSTAAHRTYDSYSQLLEGAIDNAGTLLAIVNIDAGVEVAVIVAGDGGAEHKDVVSLSREQRRSSDQNRRQK